MEHKVILPTVLAQNVTAEEILANLAVYVDSPAQTSRLLV